MQPEIFPDGIFEPTFLPWNSIMLQAVFKGYVTGNCMIVCFVDYLKYIYPAYFNL